jgi:hypothetical protein
MPELKKFYVNSYGSEAGPEQKGTLVTHEWLRGLASVEYPRIPLIKSLRVVSGMGLKDAKEAVENNCMDGFVTGVGGGTVNPDKVEAYFKQFIGPFPTEAEIAAERASKTGSTMFEACSLAYANYKLLGYPNPFAAARDVINRYEDNNDNTIR